MNNQQSLDHQIFNILYNHHLTEKAAGREFYFDLQPNGEGEQFRWFHELRTTFWAQSTNLSAHIVLGENTATFRFYIELYAVNKDGQAIQTELEKGKKIAQTLNWELKEEGGIHFEPQLYAKTYSFTDLSDFLLTFIQKEVKIINEAFSETELPRITKEKFETKLFEGNFRKDAPKNDAHLNDNNQDSKTLPTRLTYLQIQNFKAITDLKIENIAKDKQWIFLTGENGIGKTLILQAIALSLFETEELTESERREYISQNTRIAVVKYIRNERKIHNVYFNMLGFQPLKTPYRNFAMFGASRLENLTNGNRNNKTAHLFGKTTQLANIDNLFYDIRTNSLKKNQFELLKKILCELLDLTDIDIDIVAKRTIYVEKESKSPVYFAQLSAGFKNVINLIGNIIIELSDPHEEKQPKDLHGVVLIDEIEAHLHPKMQRFLVEKLTELFPKVQFIVSTHSPIPLLGAPKETVILHVDRNAEEGITVEKLAIDWENFTPDVLFSSPIFDFKTITPKSHNQSLGVRTEYTYDETLLNDEVNRRIKARSDKYKSIFGKS